MKYRVIVDGHDRPRLFLTSSNEWSGTTYNEFSTYHKANLARVQAPPVPEGYGIILVARVRDDA